MTSSIVPGITLGSPTLGVMDYGTASVNQTTVPSTSNTTPQNAIGLGSLIANQTQLTAVGGISSSNLASYYSFNLQGTSISAAFSNQSNVDYTIYDNAGNIIADNFGTPSQVTAFNQLTSAGGLSASSGTYIVRATYPSSSQTAGISQGFQMNLFSGTTFSSVYETAPPSQSPNVAVIGSSNAQLYERTAVNAINATPAQATLIGNLVTNQTQLTTIGEVIPNNNTAYYSFNLQGTSFSAALSNSSNIDYTITNSAGEVIADNNGTPAQQSAFTQLTSGGLKTAAGQYTIKATYGPLALRGQAQKYEIQLYSGTTFSSVYETTAQSQAKVSTYAEVDNTGSYATADAGLFTTTKSNQVGATASSAINVGWLRENTTSLKVVSQVTSGNNQDYYGFSFLKGSSLKLAFNNQTATAPLRVQLYDSSGLHVIADNQGSTAEKKAYAQLTSSSGLKEPNAKYIVKVSYAPGVSRAHAQTYNFQLSSGTSYSALDVTTASAQSINTALSSGYTQTFSPEKVAAAYIGATNPGIL